MLASISLSTLLLLASAAVAQDTPSIVTSIAITPSPTTEELFTIQTSVPSVSDPWSCYMECLVPPCPQCASSDLVNIPPVPTYTDSVVTVITDPLLTSVTGIMSIPPGETPVSTAPMSSSALDTSASSNGTMSPTFSPSPSATTSGLPEQTTNAAARAVQGDSLPLVAAIVGAALALF